MQPTTVQVIMCERKLARVCTRYKVVHVLYGVHEHGRHNTYSNRQGTPPGYLPNSYDTHVQKHEHAYTTINNHFLC